MSLAVIQQLVNEKADQMPNEVFGLLFDKAKANHVSFANHHLRTNQCDCLYCQSLHSYVTIKLTAHRIKRRLYSDGLAVGEYPEIEARLDSLTLITQSKRQIKNAAKDS